MIGIKIMNKKEILDTLKKLDFPKNEYIVISGASMVVQEIKNETSDIDIAISEKLEKKLTNLNYHIGFNGKKIYEMPNIEIFSDFYEETAYTIIDNIRFATLESILSLKKKLNRKKDIKDIKTLDLALCLKDNYRYEKELINKGIKLIAGMDEAGRGPLVGPVVAAACILPINYKLEGLTDSKKLSSKKREEFYDIIYRDAISIGVGIIDEKIIDEVNIYEATKLAMKQAIENLKQSPDYVLIDGNQWINIDIDGETVVHGDSKSESIAAASIVAKVTRDRMLIEWDKEYPEYGFAKHKGYGTKAHIEAIQKYGLTPIHRPSFCTKFVK